MLIAQVNKSEIIKQVIDAFKDMVNEGVWNCNKNGITMQVSFFGIVKNI